MKNSEWDKAKLAKAGLYSNTETLFDMADKLYYGWLLAYLSTSPNFGAGLVPKKLGPHTNLKTEIAHDKILDPFKQSWALANL